MQVSHDPAQNWVLGSAIVMLGGLVLSLVVRRRRVWARIIPIQSSGDVDPRCSVEVGGLARTDQANWDEGFAAMVDATCGRWGNRPPATVGDLRIVTLRRTLAPFAARAGAAVAAAIRCI